MRAQDLKRRPSVPHAYWPILLSIGSILISGLSIIINKYWICTLEEVLIENKLTADLNLGELLTQTQSYSHWIRPGDQYRNTVTKFILLDFLLLRR